MSAQREKEHHSQGLQPQDWEYYTDMPVGEILRRARMHYGQSLEDVAGVLRIRGSQLGALEEGRLELLPGRVYAIGFVRAYSEYLGLDGEKMVQLFKIQSVGSKQRPELHFPVPASESKLPNFFVLAGSLVGLIFMLAALMAIGGGDPARETVAPSVPPVPETFQVEAPQPTAPAAPLRFGPERPQAQMADSDAAPETGTQADSDSTPADLNPYVMPDRLVINVRDSAWVEIRNSNGRAILSQVLRSGDQYIVPRESGLVLATGNIGGLEFVVDGDVLPPLGNRGDVRRGITLDPDNLRQTYMPGENTDTVQTPPAALPGAASGTLR